MRNSLLAALAALTIGLAIWFTQDREPAEEVVADTEVDEAPQLIIERLNRITTDLEGVWQSTLVADQAWYFERADRLELQQPRLWAVNEDGDEYELQARWAELRDSTQWVLQDDVLILSSPDSLQTGSVRTDYLEYDTITEIAETPAAVTIVQQDRLFTTATGMTLNFATQEFELHEDVRSIFYPE